MAPTRTQAYRAGLLYCVADPAIVGEAASYRYIEDGMLVVRAGRIHSLGPAQEIAATLPADTALHVYEDALIVPGFIDTHIHYPQTEMIASHGDQLLDWLQNYTFVAEQKYADADYAAQAAELFLDELVRNGTTTALVFGTVHPESVEAFFEVALKRNLCMIAGKVMMDRNAPAELLDSAESSYRQSRELIERWHGQGRLHYAVTPRFAPTSSEAQLQAAGRLLQEYPGLYLHTHLSENQDEVAWVKALFGAEDYLSVYERFGLVGARSVFAHGIHLCDSECQRLADADASVAFCPTSNLFLGSGLLDLKRLARFGVKVGMGTDVGAGTSFSMLQTLNEAYKVQQLQGNALNPLQAFYMATLGGARILGLEDRIGTLAPGSDADFVVLDYHSTPLMQYRMQQAQSLEERLFVLMMLGDDRAVQETYVLGACAHRRDPPKQGA